MQALAHISPIISPIEEPESSRESQDNSASYRVYLLSSFAFSLTGASSSSSSSSLSSSTFRVFSSVESARIPQMTPARYPGGPRGRGRGEEQVLRFALRRAYINGTRCVKRACICGMPTCGHRVEMCGERWGRRRRRRRPEPRSDLCKQARVRRAPLAAARYRHIMRSTLSARSHAHARASERRISSSLFRIRAIVSSRRIRRADTTPRYVLNAALYCIMSLLRAAPRSGEVTSRISFVIFPRI